MAYIKINGVDFSPYVNKLKVGVKWNYKARTNASGNTTAKPINRKYILEIGIIPLNADVNYNLEQEINKFYATVEFLDPETKTIKSINTIIPQHSKDYYTIQADNVRLNAYMLALEEL